MKMKIKLLITGLLAALCTLSVSGQNWYYNGTYFTDNNWQLSATISGTDVTLRGFWGGSGGSGLLDLTKQINGGYRIAAIGNSFSKKQSLTAVKLPSTITNIPFSAFSDCSNLTSVAILEGVTSIGSSAFANCVKLTDVTLPSTLTKLDAYAFQSCSSLRTITIPANLANLDSMVFAYCGSLTNVTFAQPSALTNITGSAFFFCSNLKTITIPEGVRAIGSQAFYNCTALTNVTFAQPSALTNIASSAFAVSSLKTITIPESVTTIGGGAFSDCTSLTTVTYMGAYPSNMVGANVYYGSTSVTSYIHEAHIDSWAAVVDGGDGYNKLMTDAATWMNGRPIRVITAPVYVVPGKDGTTNTADDVRVKLPPDGAAVISNGYVVVSSVDKVCNSTNGVIYRKDGSTPVPAGSLIASNGTIFVTGSMLNPDGSVTIPPNGSIIIHISPVWTELFFPDGGEYDPVAQVVVLPDDKGEVDTNGDHTRTVPQMLGIEYDTTPIIDWDNDVFTTNSCTVVSHSIYAKVSLTDTNDWIDITGQIPSLLSATESATVALIDPVQNEEYRFFKKRIRIKSFYQP